MSHFKQRKETNCLNCNAGVQGRYCHVCGQENIEPKETFWHLLTHFVYDITHFDGKFFSTVKYLLIRPGFLSKEYIKGKRMSYLNPIRMYVFISAFFFLFFFSIAFRNINFKNTQGYTQTAAQVKEDLQKNLQKQTAKLRDSVRLNSVQKDSIRTSITEIQQDLLVLQLDSTDFDKLNYFSESFEVDLGNYKSRREYDSLQARLPTDRRDGWFKKKLMYKGFEITHEIRKERGSWMEKVFERFIHYFPQMFFISLPLVALLLQLLYIRRKDYYYVDHVIYLVHLYCAMFIFMFLAIGISELKDVRHLDWIGYMQLPVILYIAWYIYKSMRNFYQQKRAKTISKFILLLLMSYLLIMFLFILIGIMTIFSV